MEKELERLRDIIVYGIIALSAITIAEFITGGVGYLNVIPLAIMIYGGWKVHKLYSNLKVKDDKDNAR